MTTKTTNEIKNASIDTWTDLFWEIYGHHDKRRGLPQTWLMAVEDATRVGEAVRKGDFAFAVGYTAHTFCWILSFVNKLRRDTSLPDRFTETVSASDILWRSYPGICSTCLNRSCVCPILLGGKPSGTLVDSELARAAQRESKPQSLDDWQSMFEGIYGGAHQSMNISDIAFHLLEEVGEVSRAMRLIATWQSKDGQRALDEYRAELQKEIGDALSWCFSLVSKAAKLSDDWAAIGRLSGKDERPVSVSVTMSSLLVREYTVPSATPRGRLSIVCSTCNKSPCACKLAGRKWIF